MLELYPDTLARFSSAGDGELALALARTGGEGSRGLSLFAIKLRDEAGGRNGVGIHRLKNKWGTKVSPFISSREL